MHGNPQLWLLLGGAFDLLPLCLPTASAMDCNPIVITDQPRSQIVLPNCLVTFSVGPTGTGPFAYQWFRDGDAISGATNSTYMLGPVSLADNGIKIQATVENPCSRATSSEARLYISLDVVPPTLLRARGDASLQRVIVAFAVGGCPGGARLDRASAEEIYNYTLSGGIVVSNALLDSSGTTVILDTAPQTRGSLYTLMVENISDMSGNVIPRGSQTVFQSWVILPGSDPPTIVPAPMTITRSRTNIIINWPHGSQLQAAKDLTGPWDTLPDARQPYEPNLAGTARFFRALFSP